MPFTTYKWRRCPLVLRLVLLGAFGVIISGCPLMMPMMPGMGGHNDQHQENQHQENQHQENQKERSSTTSEYPVTREKPE